MSKSAGANSQAARILFGLGLGLALGLLAGSFIPEASQPVLNWWIDQVIQPAGRVFLRIIFMVVILFKPQGLLGKKEERKV
jgi:Na+/H+-dicarboxylate symporter